MEFFKYFFYDQPDQTDQADQDYQDNKYYRNNKDDQYYQGDKDDQQIYTIKISQDQSRDFLDMVVHSRFLLIFIYLG